MPAHGDCSLHHPSCAQVQRQHHQVGRSCRFYLASRHSHSPHQLRLRTFNLSTDPRAPYLGFLQDVRNEVALRRIQGIARRKTQNLRHLTSLSCIHEPSCCQAGSVTVHSRGAAESFKGTLIRSFDSLSVRAGLHGGNTDRLGHQPHPRYQSLGSISRWPPAPPGYNDVYL